jgi:hypothetical protein
MVPRSRSKGRRTGYAGHNARATSPSTSYGSIRPREAEPRRLLPPGCASKLAADFPVERVRSTAAQRYGKHDEPTHQRNRKQAERACGRPWNAGLRRRKHCSPERWRQLDYSEEALRIKIVFAGFVNDPDQTMPFSCFIR